jgi:uncharacterized membrane protein
VDARDGGEAGRPQEEMNENGTYRVDAATLKGDAALLSLLALDVAFGVVTLGLLPERVPVHWGLSGRPDRYGGPSEVALLFPIIAVLQYFFLLYLPMIDPRRRNYALFGGTLRLFRAVITVFLVGIHVAVTLAGLGRNVDVDLVVRLLLPLLFIALGNHFGRLRPNWFFGIRVPWTLENEEVWTRTHRLAGKLWVAAGVLGLPLALLPPAPGLTAAVSLLILATLVPVVYSWRIHRQLMPPRAEA